MIKKILLGLLILVVTFAIGFVLLILARYDRTFDTPYTAMLHKNFSARREPELFI